MRGGVRVEGAEGAGVLVYCVEVCVVFFEDYFAEGFFLGGARGGRDISRWEDCEGYDGGRGGDSRWREGDGWGLGRDGDGIRVVLTRYPNAAPRHQYRLRIEGIWLLRM